MPDTRAYPLIRARRRRRRWRLPAVTAVQRRVGAVLIVAMALLGGLLWASRSGPTDPLRALAEARSTLAAGNYHAARRNAERAVAVAPRLAAAQLVLARAWLAMGEGAAAEAALGRAQAAGVPPTRLHALIAEARLLQGDPAGALIEAAKEPTPEAARVRAGALAAQGQGAVAQDLLEQLVATNPKDARNWTVLGRLRLDAGELGGAADAAAVAARLAPGEPRAMTLQGEVVRARFGLVAALPWFEAALRTDAYDHPALIEYAAGLGEAGRYAEALAATRKALVAVPGSPPALYLQAVIAMRAGRPELARHLLASAGAGIADAPGALLLAGAADAATGRGEEAVAYWRRLLAVQPMNLTARRLLAGALLRSGDARGALDVLRPLAMRGDADAQALTLTARAWERTGDRLTAAGFLDRASGVGGQGALFATDEDVGALTVEAAGAAGDPTYALGVIRGRMSGGDKAGALAAARALAAAAPRDPAALLALGDTLAASGQGGAAVGAYTRAADLRFDEPTVLRLVDALGRAGKPADAAAALALYLGQNPQSLMARRLLGHWQVAAGTWDDAIETLEQVRHRAGNRDAGLLADLALAYAGDGDGETARRYGRAAYALLPMSAAVADAYGVALAAAGETAAARQLLDKALVLAPGNAAYLAHRRQLG